MYINFVFVIINIFFYNDWYMKISFIICIKFFCWYGFKCEGFIDVEVGVFGKNLCV